MDNSDTLKILNGIKNATGKIYNFDNITLDDLLTLDETGVTYLDYVCKKELLLPYKIKNEIKNSKQALYICAKNNYLYWMDDITDEDIFFEEVEDGKTLIDYIYENKVYFFNFAYFFKKRYEIIDYLIKYNKTIYQISDEIVKILFTEQNGIFLIDKYSNNEDFFIDTINRVPINILLNYCAVKSSFDILKHLKEDKLLTDIGNGKTLLEELLDRNISNLFYNYDFENKKTLDILIKKDRIDLLYKADIDLLLSSYEDKKCYFDLMIQKHYEGQNVNFEKMSFSYWNHSSHSTALELMLMAKNNIIGYVPQIKSNMLLFKQEDDDNNVLEWLLEMDRNITISTIIGRYYDKDNSDFIIALRNLGIEDMSIDYKKEEFDFSDKYIEEFNDGYCDSYTSNYEDLLIILREMFYQDGISDKGAVDALITSYRYLTSVNNRVAIIELRYLIEIKKNYPQKFVYTKDIDGGYFNKDKGVCLDNYVIGTINHETSHALHYYLSDYYIPENYLEVIVRARNNPQILSKTKEYSEKIAELKRKLKASVSQSEISDFYDSKYAGDSILELAQFLRSSKEAKKAVFKDKYQEQVLDTILAKTYSVDAFIAERKQIEVDEVVDAILRSEYDAFIAIGDIIDAIFVGKYKNGVLQDENGQNINKAYGHGIHYYSIIDHGFDEMIANYGSIIKSKNNEGILEYLRSIVGDEVVDMIANCYEQRILCSTVFISNNVEEEKSHAK